MKRIIVASILALGLLVAFVPFASAEMAKEGTYSGSTFFSGTATLMLLEKGTSVIAFETTGVLTSDSGEGPFHNMSVHCVGFHYIEKGIEKRTIAYWVYTDPDGDKVLTEYTGPEMPRAVKVKPGTIKLLGGTGKFKGIEGTFECTRHKVRPAVKGTFQGFLKAKGSWKIP